MKKRIFSAFIAVVIFIISSLPAFASEMLGYFTPFDVTVTSETGAVMYDAVWSEDMTRSILRPLTVHIPVGTQLTATDELEFNGELYLAVYYSNFYAYIKQEKTTVNVQNVGKESAFKTGAERSVVIIAKDGIRLRKGPSLAYEETGEIIPYGTVINYSAVNCENEARAQWAYTEYGGINGWIYIYQFAASDNFDCAFVLSDSDRYTGSLKVLTDGAYLTETPDPESAKTTENIPAGTTLSFRYFYEFYDSVSAYVEYNGVKGWLKTKLDGAKTATGEKGGIYVLAEDGLPLYRNAFDESEKPAEIVPAGTNLCVDYVYWDAGKSGENVLEYKWMHVNYNGTDGWIFSADASEYCYMQNAFDLKISKAEGLSMYTQPDEKSETVTVIPNGTTVTCVYEISQSENSSIAYWSYVEYNGKQGWIYSDEESAVLVEGSEKQLDAPFGAQTLEKANTDTAPELISEVSSDENNDENSDSPSTVIIICICAGIVVAGIIAFVIIKKKKAK